MKKYLLFITIFMLLSGCVSQAPKGYSFYSNKIDGFKIIGGSINNQSPCDIRRLPSPKVIDAGASIEMIWDVAFYLSNKCTERYSISILNEKVSEQFVILEALKYINEEDSAEYISKSSIKKMSYSNEFIGLPTIDIEKVSSGNQFPKTYGAGIGKSASYIKFRIKASVLKEPLLRSIRSGS